MSYGFQFTTAAGNVIVDETYKNMGMRQKTSFNLTAGSEYDVTYTGDYPLIAINSNCSAGIIEIFYFLIVKKIIGKNEEINHSLDMFHSGSSCLYKNFSSGSYQL